MIPMLYNIIFNGWILKKTECNAAVDVIFIVLIGLTSA